MTVRIKPVTYIWDGNALIPMPRFKRICDEQFLVGAEYPMTLIEARSRASHSLFFAALHEAWMTLPEKIAARYPSAEALRAKALVETGWCTEKNLVCDTAEHATQLAAHIRGWSAFTVIRVKGNIVQAFDPVSQSAKAMGKDEFERSKKDVLEWVAGLLETKLSTLKREGSKHFPEQRRSAR